MSDPVEAKGLHAAANLEVKSTAEQDPIQIYLDALLSRVIGMQYVSVRQEGEGSIVQFKVGGNVRLDDDFLQQQINRGEVKCVTVTNSPIGGEKPRAENKMIHFAESPDVIREKMKAVTPDTQARFGLPAQQVNTPEASPAPAK